MSHDEKHKHGISICRKQLRTGGFAWSYSPQEYYDTAPLVAFFSNKSQKVLGTSISKTNASHTGQRDKETRKIYRTTPMTPMRKNFHISIKINF
jgi:hypothetical protein